MEYVYILRCSNATFYVGLTNNIKRRLRSHQGGESRSTKYRLPVELVFISAFPNKKIAAKFEQYLKTRSGRAFLHKRLVAKNDNIQRGEVRR